MPLNSPANWKLVLAYDGTDFRGWQVQPKQQTIQGELSDAIERITGERVLPQGSGRTDAGVHALAQVASFELAARIPAHNLHRALNRTLPESIRVLSAETVDAGFHARHSAIGKVYEYRIWRGEICPPSMARYVYALPHPLDLLSMEQAAEAVVGEHDFTSFAASDPDQAQRTAADAGEAGLAPSNVRTVQSSAWHPEGELLSYRVSGNGFLHHMVRNLVGTFLDVGRGFTPPETLPAILAAKSRGSAGPTAPARGLFLVAVDYPASASVL